MWNHRVVRKTMKVGGRTHTFYGVHEVYYDDKGQPMGVTENSVDLYGDNPTEMLRSFGAMAEAFMKPILDYEELSKETLSSSLDELMSLKDITFLHDENEHRVSRKDYEKAIRETEKERVLSEIIYSNECEGKSVEEVMRFSAILKNQFRKTSP